MINTDFQTKDALIQNFPDENACLRHLEYLRWGEWISSPFDPVSTVYRCSHNRYRCKNTGKYFNAKTGTLFYNSRIPLQKWFLAIWILSRRKRGITSVALAAELELTQKSAWYMLQRIKNQIGIDEHIPKKKNAPRKPKKIEEIPVVIDKDKLQLHEWLQKMKK